MHPRLPPIPLLAAALLLAACDRPAERPPQRTEAPPAVRPHGVIFVQETLSRPGYAWATAERPGLHLHYLPGSYAAAHAQRLADDAGAALAHDVELSGTSLGGDTLELFMVNSREQARQLTGSGPMGQAIRGQLTAFFVTVPGWSPPFRHEIMHALMFRFWADHGSDWISEGMATWAAGSWQGHGVDAIAAGFLRDGTLPSLSRLEGRFREVDELHGYVTAASAVGYALRTGPVERIEAIWFQPPGTLEHPLGTDGPQTEAAWLRYLALVAPARVDTARLRRHGCEAP